MYLVDNDSKYVEIHNGGASYYYADGTVINSSIEINARIVATPLWYTHMVGGLVVSKSSDAYNVLASINTNFDYNAQGQAMLDALRIV